MGYVAHSVVPTSPTRPALKQERWKRAHPEFCRQGTEVDVFSNRHDQGGARPVLTLQDRDGDGSFDFLSYEARDGHGDPAGEVTDGDLDGEADFKVLPGGTGALARIGGQWCPLQKQGDRQGALIDGKWRPVRREGWRWILIE